MKKGIHLKFLVFFSYLLLVPYYRIHIFFFFLPKATLTFQLEG